MTMPIRVFLFLFLTFGSLQAGETPKTYLVFGGKTGWIGQKIIALLQEQNFKAYAAESRLESRDDLEKEISAIKPDFIINAAGITGKPNVDWCEDNKLATIRTNIIGTLNLFDVASLHGIHVTNFGTGCIYEYDEAHQEGSGHGYKEEDEPNFTGSFYSFTKSLLEKLLVSYPNVLNLRLRMPISSDMHPRNFISKIVHYQKVVNVQNSMSVLDDLLPVSIDMSQMKLTGSYNFTNPGTCSHSELLALYKSYIDPSFVWTNFSIEEQNQVLKSKRSNNELDVSKLTKIFPNIAPIQESIHKVFCKIQQDLSK